MKELLYKSLERAISYYTYRELVNQLVTEGKTTGPKQTEDLAEYTKLNSHRMKRLDKTIELRPDTIRVLEQIEYPVEWLVLTEGWCGDAGQILPILNKMAEISPNINLSILLRDDNLELMDQFLTNNGRSIPKLIMIDPDTMDVLGDWGPRPEPAQLMYQGLRKNTDLPYKKINVEMQNWYNENKSAEVQRELTAKISQLNFAILPK